MRKLFSLFAAVLFAGSMMATTVTKTVEELATANSWGNGVVVTPFALDEVISVSTEATDANTGKYYTSGQQIRLYQTGAAKMIISAAEGYTISSITLTYVSQNTGIFVEAESGVAVDFENVQSATFTIGNSGEATNGQARVTSISVTYDEGGEVPPTPADTYTVAGSDAAIFGEAWNPALTANDMVLNDGLYTWEKDGLNLTAGTIEFKVVKNHSWDIAYPAQNYVVNIAEDGEYTLTITFDPSTEAVFAEAVKAEPLADPTNCAEAAAAALSVSANNELYNNGAVYTIEGYVTSIKTAYSDQYHNISFWMADTQDGGEVIQAYRAACASEADAPAVGDKVAVTGSLTKYNTTPEFAAACTFVILNDPTPVDPQTETIYDWTGEIGTTILDGAEVANVKIHTNTDEISAIKISSSSHRVAIKPAEGAFQAGDSIFIAVCFNNADETKQAQIRAYAADGTTMLFESAQGVNGRTSADDPAVQVFALEAAQDSILFARQGNTATYISFLKAVRPASTPVEPTVNYYIAGSMNGWAANEAYMLTPNNESLYEGEFTFAANDEFKVIGFDGTNTTWYPEGMGNNYVITEAGDYKITFNPAGNVEGWYAGFYNVVKKEAPIVHQYEVAEAIAAGLQENDEVLVRGIITKMEFKGKNFAKYGSVNVYVADATGAEGEFEFYNCYSLNADTFRTSVPNYDPESTAWAQFNEVADANGNAIHVGDTVIAFGKYKLYNSTHELNTGCYLVDIKHAPVAPADTINLDFNTENTTYAFVDNQYFVEYGTTDIYLSDININTSTHQFEGDGNYLVLDFYPENANNVTGVYQAQDETLDLEYTYMLTINGTDTAVVEFADGAIQVEIGEVNKELGMAQLALAGQLISTEGDIYAITAIVIAYYDFLPEEGVEEVVLDPKSIKRLVNGQVIIEKAGKNYNMNGQVIR